MQLFPHMTDTHQIQCVVAYDFSGSGDWALSRAIEAASRAPQHILHIVTVLDPHERLAIVATEPPTWETADVVRDMLNRYVAQAIGLHQITTHLHVRIGKAANEVLELAAEVGAELIFVGSHGKTGIERVLLGSTSERIVREARCPVLVARPTTYEHVELQPVEHYEHERGPHREPHVYSTSTVSLTRPNNWPIS